MRDNALPLDIINKIWSQYRETYSGVYVHLRSWNLFLSYTVVWVFLSISYSRSIL